MTGSGRLLGGALALLLLLLAVLAGFLPTGAGERLGSAVSASPRGRLAAYLLLAELGFEPELWRGAPGDLPREPDLLWLSLAPEAVSFYDGGQDEDVEGGGLTASARRARRLLEPAHYERFLREGGTLVISLREVGDLDAGRALANREFVAEVLNLPELAALESEELGRTVPQEALLVGGERLGLRSPQPRAFAPLPEPLAARGDLDVLAVDALRLEETGEEWPLALRAGVGRGWLVLLADDRWLENKSLSRGDNGLYLVRLVEQLMPPGRPGGSGVLRFDDFGVGGWEPGSWAGLLVSRRGLLASVQVALLLLALAWALGWVRSFPRDPRPLERLSPLARARALAALYLRAGRPDLLAELLRGGLRRRIAATALGAGRRALEGEAFERALAAHAQQTGRAEELPRWRRLFGEQPVRTPAELERLGAELAELEVRPESP